jgi:hypothetical protein
MTIQGRICHVHTKSAYKKFQGLSNLQFPHPTPQKTFQMDVQKNLFCKENKVDASLMVTFSN